MAEGDVAEVTEKGGAMGFVHGGAGWDAGLGDGIEEAMDMGDGGDIAGGLVDDSAFGIEDAIALGAEDEGGVAALEGDAGGFAFEAEGQATAVFPEDDGAGEFVGDDLGIGGFLVVVEPVATAGGEDAGGVGELEGGLDEVEEVDAVVAEFAGAPVPEPMPIVMDDIGLEGAFGGGTLPEGVVEPVGDGGGLAAADGTAAVGVPGAGEADGAEFAGAYFEEGLLDPGDGATLEADLDHLTGLLGGGDQPFAFLRVMADGFFEVHMFAGLEGEDGGGGVPMDGGGDDQGIQLGVLEGATEIVGDLERLGLSGVDAFSGGLEGAAVHIGEPADLGALGGEEGVDEGLAAAVEAHESYVDGWGVGGGGGGLAERTRHGEGGGGGGGVLEKLASGGHGHRELVA